MTTSITTILQALRLKHPSASSPTAPQQPAHKTFPRQSIDGVLPSGLPEISLADVAHHDAYEDCWVIIYDRVYDVTNFLHSHPGGTDVIMDHAGRDATLAFHGTGHSRDAIEQMHDYLIGELPPKERIFRVDSCKILSSGIPD